MADPTPTAPEPDRVTASDAAEKLTHVSERLEQATQDLRQLVGLMRVALDGRK